MAKQLIHSKPTLKREKHLKQDYTLTKKVINKRLPCLYIICHVLYTA